MMPTALIVEDEPEANRLLSMLVQLRGYQTESAFTGGQALEMVQDRPPDIVFLDLMLPDTNGYEVCQALKTSRQTHRIPVVIVTARLAEENRVYSARVGADEFVSKPYTPDQIFQVLSAADTWRQAADDQADRGEIALDTRDNHASFTQLQQLRGLLLTRSPLDEEAVQQIHQALLDLSLDALDWGCRRGVERVAALDYELSCDCLVLTVRDLGGWFAGSQRSGEERLAKAIAKGQFDDVNEDHVHGKVVLVRRFLPSSE